VYTYDSLNRLIQAETAANQNVTQWGQGFVYDGFGNLLQKNVTKGSAPTLQVTVDSGNHVITTGMVYDAAGNPTQMNLTGSGLQRLTATAHLGCGQPAGGSGVRWAVRRQYGSLRL